MTDVGQRNRRVRSASRRPLARIGPGGYDETDGAL